MEQTKLMEKQESFFSNPIVKFLLKAAMVYILWEFCNWFRMRNVTFNTGWMYLHDIVRDNIVYTSSDLLRLFGYNVEQFGIVVRIANTSGVAVGPACVGFGLLFSFAGIIISYHGRVKDKLWFIPLGLLGIHIINILRITILAIISKVNNDMVEFNHKYVFNTIVYIFIFMMWVLWVRIVEKRENKTAESAVNS